MNIHNSLPRAPFALALSTLTLLVTLVTHCGGSVAAGPQVDGGRDALVGEDAAPEHPPDAGDDASLGDSGLCEGTAGQGAPSGVPSEHRSSAVTCPRSPGFPDGGPSSCNADSDCDSGAHCTERACGYDACLIDGDCPSGNVCVCGSDARGGLGARGNVCAPAKCAVDADCGSGAYCVPSRGYCDSISGFFCTTPKDTCVEPTRDCSCGGNACVYAPMVGHFVCSTATCSG